MILTKRKLFTQKLTRERIFKLSSRNSDKYMVYFLNDNYHLLIFLFEIFIVSKLTDNQEIQLDRTKQILKVNVR